MSYESDLELVGKFLEGYTFEYLINEALKMIPDELDKREGSIIYDALAPACYELSRYYIQLRYAMYDIFPQTAADEYLDLRVEEFGLKRMDSTKSIRKGYFKTPNGEPTNVPIGTRFSTVEEIESLTYKVIKDSGITGEMLLECEDYGTKGNRYNGVIIPLDNIKDLGSATLGNATQPARDTETDAELRERLFTFVNEKPFGGNFIEYVNEASSFKGVGACQVYPVWNGGGTVKVVIIDSDLKSPTSTLIKELETYFDPKPHNGSGNGIAPIGHKVTVEAPKEVPIKVVLDIELTDTTLTQVREPIEEQIALYFKELRKKWGKPAANHQYYLYVYRAQIISRIIENVTGVANIKGVTLNGEDDDIQMELLPKYSQIPTLNGVTLNEVYSK